MTGKARPAEGMLTHFDNYKQGRAEIDDARIFDTNPSAYRLANGTLGCFIRVRLLIDTYDVKVQHLARATRIDARKLYQGVRNIEALELDRLIGYFADLQTDPGGRKVTGGFFDCDAREIADLREWLELGPDTWPAPAHLPRVEDAARADKLPAEFEDVLLKLQDFVRGDGDEAVAALEGAPGSGKTAVLSGLLSRRWPKKGRRPLYVDCRHNPTVELLIDALSEQLDANGARPGPTERWKQFVELLRRTPSFIVLDNFDLPRADAAPGETLIRAENYADALFEALAEAPATKVLVAGVNVRAALTDYTAGTLEPLSMPLLDARRWIAERADAPYYKGVAPQLIALLDGAGLRTTSGLILRLAAMTLVRAHEKAEAMDEPSKAKFVAGVLEGVSAALSYGRVRWMWRAFEGVASEEQLAAVRTIALAEDGVRDRSMLSILREVGKFREFWTAERVKATLKTLSPITFRVGEGEARVTDLFGGVRKLVNESWSAAGRGDRTLAPRIHRAIARVAWTTFVALPATDKDASGGPSSAAFRLVVQTYVHLLASIDTPSAREPGLEALDRYDDLAAKFLACQESPQDCLDLAYCLITRDIEGGDNQLSRAFGAEALKMDLYLRWFFIGRPMPAPIAEVLDAPSHLQFPSRESPPPNVQAKEGAAPAVASDEDCAEKSTDATSKASADVQALDSAPDAAAAAAAPDEPAEIARDKGLLDIVYEKVAIAALRSHHLPVCAQMVLAGIRRTMRRGGLLDATRLRLIEVDLLLRKGRLDHAEQVARRLYEDMSKVLNATFDARGPIARHRVPLAQRVLRHYARAAGRLAEVRDLRGDALGAHKYFWRALTGAARLNRRYELETCPNLSPMFTRVGNIGLVFKPSSTTRKALLEFSIRQARLGWLHKSEQHTDDQVRRANAAIALTRASDQEVHERNLASEAVGALINRSLEERYRAIDEPLPHTVGTMKAAMEKAREHVWARTVAPIVHLAWLEEWARVQWHIAGVEPKGSQSARDAVEQARRAARRFLYYTEEHGYVLLQADALLLLAEINLTADVVAGAANVADEGEALLGEAAEIIETRMYDYRIEDWRILSDPERRRTWQPARMLIR